MLLLLLLLLSKVVVVLNAAAVENSAVLNRGKGGLRRVRGVKAAENIVVETVANKQQ